MIDTILHSIPSAILTLLLLYIRWRLMRRQQRTDSTLDSLREILNREIIRNEKIESEISELKIKYELKRQEKHAAANLIMKIRARWPMSAEELDKLIDEHNREMRHGLSSS